MRTIDQLDQWLAAGRIDLDQHRRIAALVERRRISVFAELNVTLYVGVLAFTAGLAWTINAHATEWASVAILSLSTLAMAICFAYCVKKAPRYANGRVAAPNAVFDYVLYLGCLIFATELGYLQYRFGVLQVQWNIWLLQSAIFYLLLAYRFDNRFVLSLAIATLGAWFGVRLSRFQVVDIDVIRLSALSFAALIAVAGGTLWRNGIKRHFLETYLHVAVNVALAALLSGVFADRRAILWLLALLVASSAAIVGGLRSNRFAFVVYGTLFGYIGISSRILDGLHGDIARLAYVTVSAAIVVIGLVIVARRTGSTE